MSFPLRKLPVTGMETAVEQTSHQAGADPAHLFENFGV